VRRLSKPAAAVVVLAGLLVGLTLPPARLPLPAVSDGTLAGVLHIHTNRSDGRSSPAEIAAIAARAGLSFIVLTDHGAATRVPDPPAYHSGVLVLDALELSTEGGHLVLLDMTPAPDLIWGAPATVIEQVRRLGAFVIVAHPDSPKIELRWQAWDLPFDAVEWINPDTSWRVRMAGDWGRRLGLFGGLLHYGFRPEETIASLLTSADDTLARWTAVAARRRVVGLAGADAHAKLALVNSDPGDNRYSLPLPSYGALFRTLSVHVALDEPLSGDAATDAGRLLRAIRAGHLYTVVDGFASPASFEFTAKNARGAARQGDEIAAGGPLTLRVRSNAPDGFRTIVWRDGEAIATEARREFTIEASDRPGVYRVEIRTGEAGDAMTWLLSNPIYVRQSN
jgi:hypothetical protein